jgi:hypothetical protein
MSTFESRWAAEQGVMDIMMISDIDVRDLCKFLAPELRMIGALASPLFCSGKTGPDYRYRDRSATLTTRVFIDTNCLMGDFDTK